MKLTFSQGNKKLPKTTGIFNLPAARTCPGKTAACSAYCYAIRPERFRPVVSRSRQDNLALSRRADFPLRLGIAIDYLPAQRVIRIHESGDFYNLAYIRAWLAVMRRYPNKVFYAYTRSFALFTQIPVAEKPANFKLLASFDQTTTAAQRVNHARAKAWFCGTFSVVDKGAGSCPGDCRICSRCWTTGGHLTVGMH